MGQLLSAGPGEQNNSSSITLNGSDPIVTTTEVSEANNVVVATNPHSPRSDYNYDSTDNTLAFDLPKQQHSGIPNTTTTSENPLSINNGTSSSVVDGNSPDDFKFEFFGTSVYPFRWLTLPTLYSWLGPLSSLAMVLGCVLPYVPQYATIYKNKNCAGFSTFVCLTLLLANILRIAFWFGHPFELPLLIQSIIMILAQLLLLELCVRVKRQYEYGKRSFLGSHPRYFWRWSELVSYIEFLCLFSALIAIATYFLADCEPFVESLGYCALVTESLLGLPQVIQNYKNSSVRGMSLCMVLMWLGGDTFKTGYFILNNVPFQFWLCGLLQITIDLLILFQVCLYRQNAPIKVNSRVNESPKEMMAL